MTPKYNFVEYRGGYSAPTKKERDLQVQTLVSALLKDGPGLEPMTVGYVRAISAYSSIYKISNGFKTPFGKAILEIDPNADLFAAPLGKNSTRKFAILTYAGKTFVVYQIQVTLSTVIGIVEVSTMTLSKVNNQVGILASIKIDNSPESSLPLLINDEAIQKNEYLKKKLYKRMGFYK